MNDTLIKAQTLNHVTDLDTSNSARDASLMPDDGSQQILVVR